jgi:GntR family transcriptional regulator
MRVGRSSEIRDALRQRVTSGEYGPGDRLPRLTDLMSIYGTRSRGVIDRALRALVAEGLLTVRHGSGIYVRRPAQPVRYDLLARPDLFEVMAGAGAVAEVTCRRGPASEEVAALLGIEPNCELLIRESRYLVGGTPHHAVTSYLPVAAGLAGSVDGADIGDVDRFHLRVETRVPTQSEARDLAMEGGTTVFELWRVLYRAGASVEVAVAVVPGDRAVFEADLTDWARAD